MTLPNLPAVQINAFEAFWILTCAIGAIVTAAALVDAWADRAAVKLLNGPIRTRIARGAVRREVFRLISQLLLLAVALPAIFTPGDVPLNPQIAALLAVPAVILASTLMDYNDRHALNVLTSIAAAKLERQDEVIAAQDDELTAAAARAPFEEKS